MTSLLADLTSSSTFFDVVVFVLPSLTINSNFMLISLISYEVMTFFIYKGLTRISEIGNTNVWVSSNIWRLGKAGNIKFGRNVSNEKLLNSGKCQIYNFYHFWVIKRKPTGRGGRGGKGAGGGGGEFFWFVNSWRKRW